MKVSVIVPVYNTAPFVEESILSVQRQIGRASCRERV